MPLLSALEKYYSVRAVGSKEERTVRIIEYYTVVRITGRKKIIL
jgi:hypothetical protein